ncbi:Uncharacterised protein [Chlamydia trachomatis]|nr:Uncharacterised protein [Chlamydia trachomatis]
MCNGVDTTWQEHFACPFHDDGFVDGCRPIDSFAFGKPLRKGFINNPLAFYLNALCKNLPNGCAQGCFIGCDATGAVNDRSIKAHVGVFG